MNIRNFSQWTMVLRQIFVANGVEPPDPEELFPEYVAGYTPQEAAEMYLDDDYAVCE